MIFIVVFVSKAQTYILQEDFSSITSGNNTGTSGANSAWLGNTNFPSETAAYQAGGAVKLGTGSLSGSITSKTLDLSVNGGNFTVSFDVKVTVTGLIPQTVTYSAVMSSTAFENKIITFSGGAANSTVTIETSAKRAYIDNVNVYTSCSPSNIAFANPSISKFIIDQKFTQTATSLNTASQITYSSSSTSVANVNSTTGEVTIIGVGSTNIIASQIGTGNYCAGTTSYSLTVTPLPTLTLTDVSNLNFTTTVTNPVSQTINIYGVNLSTDLGIVLSGPDAGLFTLSQYSIMQISGTAPNTTVTLTYLPIYPGTHSATMTMTSTGAIDVTRTITGNAILAGIDETSHSNISVIVENMNLKFYTDADETFEIYNAFGQKLMQGLTIQGLNIIPIKTHGIVLIRVGNKLSKVVL